MKKIYMIITFIIISFLSILYSPLRVKAEEDLYIPKWEVNANLYENGDLAIEEYITFEFNDNFNGVFRDISLNKTSGITDIKVDETTDNTSINYDNVKKAKNGESKVFLIVEEKDNVQIKIFAPSKHVTRTFRICYIIKNVAVKYNDTSELYYKFLGDENVTPIGVFKVNINLPKDVSGNQIKIFAHGPLNGKVREVDSNTYSLYVENVSDKTYIEGRILFPNSLIPKSTNIKNIDNYDNILEEETAFQNKRIADSKRMEAIKRYLEQGTIVVSALGLILFITLLNRYRRNKEILEKMSYSGIPDDCSPAVAAYFTGNQISTNVIFATILDLFRRGYVRIFEDNCADNENSEKKSFTITLMNKNETDLLNHEKYFIKWLFYDIGDGETVSTNDIEEYSKKHNSKFVSRYNIWKNEVKNEAVEKGYYDRSKRKIGILVLLFSIITFVLGLVTCINGSINGVFGIITSIILFIYSLTLIERLSDHGYLLYKKWLLFKKDMKKQSFDIESLARSGDISLIYALSLGAVKKLKFMKLNTYDFTDETYSNNSWVFWYIVFISDDNNTFHKSFDHSFGSITSDSSGSFSSGGGGGAGGGGAGGF